MIKLIIFLSCCCKNQIISPYEPEFTNTMYSEGIMLINGEYRHLDCKGVSLE